MNRPQARCLPQKGPCEGLKSPRAPKGPKPGRRRSKDLVKMPKLPQQMAQNVKASKVSMCGIRASKPIKIGTCVDRQRDFVSGANRPTACRIYYNGRLDPQALPRSDRTKNRTQINRNRHQKNLLYHHSIDAISSNSIGREWFDRHQADKYKRLFHAGTHFPKELEQKIWLLTGGPCPESVEASLESKEASTAKPPRGSQTSRQHAGQHRRPTRTLLQRRSSIDLCILKLKLDQKLQWAYRLFDNSGCGDLNEVEFRRAAEMLKMKPFTNDEIRRLTNTQQLFVSIDEPTFIKLIGHRISHGDKIRKHQNLLSVLDKFSKMHSHLAAMGDADSPEGSEAQDQYPLDTRARTELSRCSSGLAPGSISTQNHKSPVEKSELKRLELGAHTHR